MRHLFVTLACGLAAACASASGPVRADSVDPYIALRLYDGKWWVSSSDGKHLTLENHCARSGLFFSCEQVVDGKPAALVVFLPREKVGERQAYRTMALAADGTGVHSWHNLIIEGDHWTYPGDETPPGAGARDRTLNTVIGPDHIHFEIQVSTDGKSWSTTLSGDETRAPLGH